MMRDRLVTDYIRKRVSIQNEENWSQDGTLGGPNKSIQFHLTNHSSKLRKETFLQYKMTYY